MVLEKRKSFMQKSLRDIDEWITSLKARMSVMEMRMAPMEGTSESREVGSSCSNTREQQQSQQHHDFISS
jgi:hypothetical protein